MRDAEGYILVSDELVHFLKIFLEDNDSRLGEVGCVLGVKCLFSIKGYSRSSEAVAITLKIFDLSSRSMQC